MLFELISCIILKICFDRPVRKMENSADFFILKSIMVFFRIECVKRSLHLIRLEESKSYWYEIL